MIVTRLALEELEQINKLPRCPHVNGHNFNACVFSCRALRLWVLSSWDCRSDSESLVCTNMNEGGPTYYAYKDTIFKSIWEGNSNDIWAYLGRLGHPGRFNVGI